MDDSLSVYISKPWIDHDQGLLWTVSDQTNTWIQLTIGVFFGLAQPYLERIVSHSIGWIYYCVEAFQWKPDHVGGVEISDENTALLGRKSRSCCLSSNYCNKHYSRNAIAKLSSLVIVVFGIAYTVAGTFVTTIPTDKAALSGSRKCGLWGLKDNALPVAQDEDALVQGQKETRAGQYARDCYGPQSALSLDQCSIFKKPYVPTYKIEPEQHCPFVNETYCMGNGFAAVKFSTGLVDTSTIGINAKEAPQFNRTMMCVPLNIYQGFVEKTSSQPGHWGFKLGSVSSDEYSSNYTFRQYGDPFTFDVRSYTTSTYVHVYPRSTRQNYWAPIPELDIRPELNIKSKPYSLTLLFINSCRIFYKEISNDPIFPADRRLPDNPDLWINNDSRARPLACIDWIEVCTNGGDCLPPYEESEEHDFNYEFTRFALNKSTAFHAIEYRGATGLNAQYKIKDDTSLPLDKDPTQWIRESWGLFNTSLSRIQHDALDIANGTGWDKEPRYNQKMPHWAQGDGKICGIFTFGLPKGYDNIRIWPTIGILAIPLVLWLMGRQTGEEFDETRRRSGYFGEDRLLGVEWLCWRIKVIFVGSGAECPVEDSTVSETDTGDQRGDVTS